MFCGPEGGWGCVSLVSREMVFQIQRDLKKAKLTLFLGLRLDDLVCCYERRQQCPLWRIHFSNPVRKLSGSKRSTIEMLIFVCLFCKDLTCLELKIFISQSLSWSQSVSQSLYIVSEPKILCLVIPIILTIHQVHLCPEQYAGKYPECAPTKLIQSPNPLHWSSHHNRQHCLLFL